MTSNQSRREFITKQCVLLSTLFLGFPKRTAAQHRPGPGTGHLWHTLRDASGKFTGLGNVTQQLNIAVIDPVSAVAAAKGANGETQFMFVGGDGLFGFTRRFNTGRWGPVDDMRHVTTNMPQGNITAIAGTSSSNGQTQFIFTTADGHLWHVVRQANGHWSPVGNLHRVLGVPGPVVAVSAAEALGGEAQFMFATADGHPWHSLRHVDKTWTGLGDVSKVTNIPGPVKLVAGSNCGVYGAAQFAFTTVDGHLWHVVRGGEGEFTQVGDVHKLLQIPGPVSALGAAEGAGPGEAQFMFATTDGHPWHSLRRANKSWTPLGDVLGQFSIPGAVRMIAGTGGGHLGEAQFIFVA